MVILISFLKFLNEQWGSKMEVKFLGVRGSTATPGNEFSKFGGNTSCTEIIHKDFQVILDAGTGFTDISIRKDVPVLVLFSHFHFDQIQGLPFLP